MKVTSTQRPIRNISQERVSPSTNTKKLGVGKFVLTHGILSQNQPNSPDIVIESFLPTTGSITSLSDSDSDSEDNDDIYSQEQQHVPDTGIALNSVEIVV